MNRYRSSVFESKWNRFGVKSTNNGPSSPQYFSSKDVITQNSYVYLSLLMISKAFVLDLDTLSSLFIANEKDNYYKRVVKLKEDILIRNRIWQREYDTIVEYVKEQRGVIPKSVGVIPSILPPTVVAVSAERRDSPMTSTLSFSVKKDKKGGEERKRPKKMPTKEEDIMTSVLDSAAEKREKRLREEPPLQETSMGLIVTTITDYYNQLSTQLVGFFSKRPRIEPQDEFIDFTVLFFEVFINNQQPQFRDISVILFRYLSVENMASYGELLRLSLPLLKTDKNKNRTMTVMRNLNDLVIRNFGRENNATNLLISTPMSDITFIILNSYINDIKNNMRLRRRYVVVFLLIKLFTLDIDILEKMAFYNYIIERELLDIVQSFLLFDIITTKKNYEIKESYGFENFIYILVVEDSLLPLNISTNIFNKMIDTDAIFTNAEKLIEFLNNNKIPIEEQLEIQDIYANVQQKDIGLFFKFSDLETINQNTATEVSRIYLKFQQMMDLDFSPSRWNEALTMAYDWFDRVDEYPIYPIWFQNVHISSKYHDLTSRNSIFLFESKRFNVTSFSIYQHMDTSLTNNVGVIVARLMFTNNIKDVSDTFLYTNNITYNIIQMMPSRINIDFYMDFFPKKFNNISTNLIVIQIPYSQTITLGPLWTGRQPIVLDFNKFSINFTNKLQLKRNFTSMSMTAIDNIILNFKNITLQSGNMLSKNGLDKQAIKRSLEINPLFWKSSLNSIFKYSKDDFTEFEIHFDESFTLVSHHHVYENNNSDLINIGINNTPEIKEFFIAIPPYIVPWPQNNSKSLANFHTDIMSNSSTDFIISEIEKTKEYQYQFFYNFIGSRDAHRTSANLTSIFASFVKAKYEKMTTEDIKIDDITYVILIQLVSLLYSYGNIISIQKEYRSNIKSNMYTDSLSLSTSGSYIKDFTHDNLTVLFAWKQITELFFDLYYIFYEFPKRSLMLSTDQWLYSSYDVLPAVDSQSLVGRVGDLEITFPKFIKFLKETTTGILNILSEITDYLNLPVNANINVNIDFSRHFLGKLKVLKNNFLTNKETLQTEKKFDDIPNYFLNELSEQNEGIRTVLQIISTKILNNIMFIYETLHNYIKERLGSPPAPLPLQE